VAVPNEHELDLPQRSALVIAQTRLTIAATDALLRRSRELIPGDTTGEEDVPLMASRRKVASEE
jgi:hypothetical protein